MGQCLAEASRAHAVVMTRRGRRERRNGSDPWAAAELLPSGDEEIPCGDEIIHPDEGCELAPRRRCIRHTDPAGHKRAGTPRVELVADHVPHPRQDRDGRGGIGVESRATEWGAEVGCLEPAPARSEL